MFPKKTTCWGMKEKSLCLLGGGTSEPKGNSFAGTHTPRTPLVGFCHCYAPSRINPFSQATFAPSSLPDPQHHPL